MKKETSSNVLEKLILLKKESRN